MIRVEGLGKRFGKTWVLEDFSCEIKEGERVAVIGPSGAGKSVLLRCLGGLEKPDAGNIWIGGDRVTGSRGERARALAHTGMVFQQFNLFSHLTVLDNIALAPIANRHATKAEAFRRARELLAQVGLPEKAEDFPAQLSGGQQQRVAIARALACDPEVLLFDEPTSALDPSMTTEVLDVIARIAQRGKTLLIVTHELPFVRDIADRVLFLEDRSLYEEGAPQALLTHPARAKTQAYLSHVKGL